MKNHLFIVRWALGLRIGTRLAIGFAVLLGFVLLVGAIGVVGIGRLDTRVNDIVVYNNAKLGFAQSLHRAVSGQEAGLLKLVLADRAQQSDEALASINYQIGQYNDAKSGLIEILGLSKPTQAEEKTVAAMASGEASAAPLVAKIMKLVGDDDTEGALRLLRTDVKSALDKWKSDIDELVSTEQRLNDTASTATQKEAALLRTISLVSIVVAIVLGVVIAYMLSRSLTHPAAQAAAVAKRIADGDLTLDVTTNLGCEMGNILTTMQAMQVSLREVVGAVREHSQSVATAASQIAQGNNDLSMRTEEQASALEQTAASMEQLGSTVNQNAGNAKQANQLASNASSVAIKGGEVVAQVVETMKGINDSSKKIGAIISVIDGIAFQTNILALNAAVEAARAGEQGRGFAVVASEVRSLAGRSAEAAKEIKGLINASVERVEHGTTLVGQAGVTMTEVVASFKRVNDIVSEITTASIEQSAGVAQIGEAVNQMDQVTQQNASLVEEGAAAAESLKSQALALVRTVSVFKL